MYIRKLFKNVNLTYYLHICYYICTKFVQLIYGTKLIKICSIVVNLKYYCKTH